MAGQENEVCTGKVDSEVALFKAIDINKDTETNICFISIPDDIDLSQNANVPAKLNYVLLQE